MKLRTRGPESHDTKLASSGRVKTNVKCRSLLTILLAGVLLKSGLSNSSLTSRSISHLWSLGFGNVTSESLAALNMSGTTGLIVTTIVANLPQVLLSFLYLMYNSLFTCMLLGKEWNDFAYERKYLRVSLPKGSQRSTYFLQLPYRYGVPLLITSGLLHWLVSQSIFLARIDVFDGAGAKLGDESISTCGYSNIAIIFVIVVGLLVILTGIAHGFRRYKPGIPLAGSCSAAISAACHGPPEDEKASLKPVKWGVAPQSKDEESASESVGHCCFTSLPVDFPIEDSFYAGLKSGNRA